MTRDRHEANGEGLKGLIEQFVAADDPAVRDALMEQILLQPRSSPICVKVL
jgi:hypothetical protein